MIPTINRHNFSEIDEKPVKDWLRYRKTAETPMVRWKGAATIDTLEGEIGLPPSFDGWIAVDPRGYPYPIDRDVHRTTYEVVG